jgi:phosphatidylglycerol:prolipoprotein diacylglycerol transferase
MSAFRRTSHIRTHTYSMYPVLFRIGGIEITSFGVMVALGTLAGLWSFAHELSERDLPASALNAALAGVIGGLVGAKLLWTAEHFGEGPLLNLLTSRGGLSWFGGFVGGVGTGLIVIRRERLPIIPVVAAASIGLALGQAIGRIGCFLVGDDYGKPSHLPWAVPFPSGLPPTDVPVHPTQIYEAIALALLAALLLFWRRHHVADRILLARYLILAGAIRFAIEFLRVNVRVLGPFTLAHLVAAGVMAAGFVLLQSGRAGAPTPRT